MKLTKLICLPLLAMSINAFAYKVISEKMTSSPGFNGHVVSITKDNNVKKNISPHYASAESVAYDAEGRIEEYIKIQGEHSVNIMNHTDKTVRYTYGYILSCQEAYNDYERTIELSPNEDFIDSSYSYGVVQKLKEGTFAIHVITKISGEEFDSSEQDAVLKVHH